MCRDAQVPQVHDEQERPTILLHFLRLGAPLVYRRVSDTNYRACASFISSTFTRRIKYNTNNIAGIPIAAA